MNAVDSLLLDVCRGPLPGQPDSGLDAQELTRAARFHRIAPLVYVALREDRPDLAGHLRIDRDTALMHHLHVSGLLGRVAATLDKLQWLVFKGPVLAEHAHPVPGLRFYKDLDILVSPSSIREACTRLTDAGWRPYVSKEALLSGVIPGEIPLISPQGVTLDLHWSMLVTRARRERFAATADQLLGRRVPLAIGPVGAWSLDPLDSLVHVCQHAALAGAVKLGHILDADQLARQVVDWPALAGRAREWLAAAQVSVVLGRARHLLRTPLPSDLDRLLGVSPAFSALTGAVDRRWPIPPLRKEESVARLFARAARPTAPSTISAVARSGVLNLRERIHPAAPLPERSLVGREQLDDYFAVVESLPADEASLRASM